MLRKGRELARELARQNQLKIDVQLSRLTEDNLRELAEVLEAPVTGSLEGKSAFPEDHPLSLGIGSRAVPKPVLARLT